MFINLHTHTPEADEESMAIIQKEASFPSDKAGAKLLHSKGIHPWHITPDWKNKIQMVAPAPGLLAIGECGLDRHKGADLDTQKEVFEAHIALSEQLKLPLIIHCVKAYSDIIKMRKDLRPEQDWIFHAYNAGRQTTEQALKHGFYFSMGKAILNHSSKAVQSLNHIPTHRLFLETDDEPTLKITAIYEKAAYILNLESVKLQHIIQDNFKQVFNVNV
ncbi:MULTISPECIES: TatD family hydrolase [unclassified Carboxylicivirga]|uniref:TatD family hydrolase n=1 Tax=Carboxylicivirga TaxID=1628153 RepID=UPI003D357531